MIGPTKDRDFASSALSLEKEIAAKIDIGDIARAFAAQPYIIRQLPRLLADTGFAIESHRSYVIADVGRAEFFSEQLTTWRRLLPVSGVIGKGDADFLMNSLEAASAAGTLFWANNFYTHPATRRLYSDSQRRSSHCNPTLFLGIPQRLRPRCCNKPAPFPSFLRSSPIRSAAA